MGAPSSMGSTSGGGTLTKDLRALRSVTSASTSCTAPTTSCQSLLVELARRSSTLLVSTSGSPHQTIPLVHYAETSSEEFCNKLIPSTAVLWERCRNIHISNVILE